MGNKFHTTVLLLLSFNTVILCESDSAGNSQKVPIFIPFPLNIGKAKCCLVIYPPKCDEGNCVVRRRKECGEICPENNTVVIVRGTDGINVPEALIPATWTNRDDIDENITITQPMPNPLDKNLLWEKPLYPSNQRPGDLQQPNQKPSFQQPSYAQPSTQQPTNQQPINQQPTNQQHISQQPISQQPINQQPINQQPSNQQPINQQLTNQKPIKQQPTNQQPTNQQPTNQQPSYKQPSYQEAIYQQPFYGQPLYQKPYWQDCNQRLNYYRGNQQPFINQQQINQQTQWFYPEDPYYYVFPISTSNEIKRNDETDNNV